MESNVVPAGLHIDHGQAVTGNDPLRSLAEAGFDSGRAVFRKVRAARKECDTVP